MSHDFRTCEQCGRTMTDGACVECEAIITAWNKILPSAMAKEMAIKKKRVPNRTEKRAILKAYKK